MNYLTKQTLSFYSNQIVSRLSTFQEVKSVRLGRNYFYPHLCFQRFTLFFFFWHAFQETNFTIMATIHALFMNSSRNIWLFSTSVGPVYYSQNPQTSLFSNFFIKNRSHGTIHTFKNYFATIFSVFNCIQMNPKWEWHKRRWKKSFELPTKSETLSLCWNQ